LILIRTIRSRFNLIHLALSQFILINDDQTRDKILPVCVGEEKLAPYGSVLTDFQSLYKCNTWTM